MACNILHCRAIFYKFGSAGKNYQEAFNFNVMVNDENKESLKNIKDEIL